ncbi:hypothetical protein [Rhizobium sp. Root1203]|jgi:hypothetical protein|uniref:hypothetical protein n=1 Tax=Rhizobium sp. Root1203 TaxID=1736427 RepID=UPI000AAD3A04
MTMKEETETLSAGDYEALANLRFALRKFTEFSTIEVQRLGITLQQHIRRYLQSKGCRR